MSSQFPIGHMNVLNLGGTDIELHIHPGTETCDGCEPGQVQANLRNENRGKERFSRIIFMCIRLTAIQI